jgi:hypothetical protein
MPEPIAYQMLTNLKAALLAMSVATGYYYDMPAAAVKLDSNVDIEAIIGNQALRPFSILEVLPETRQYKPAGRMEVRLPVNIHWISEAAELNDLIRMQLFFRGCADVERGITRDITRGGLAVDQRIVDCELDRTLNGTQVWAVIKTEILFRRVYGEA